jgi:hypothetical protein
MDKTQGNYKIIENFFSKQQHSLIEKTLTDDIQFPWFLSNEKVSDSEFMKIGDIDNYQFVHVWYKDKTINSNYCDNLTVLFDSIIQPLSFLRIKANLTPKADSIKKYGWHVDFPGNKHKTAIYYVNTNNGKTIFKNGLEIDSVANRLVIFDGNMEHTGTTCTDKRFRCVINLNYIEK